MQSQQNNNIITLENVVVGYDHDIILPNVDLAIRKGDFMAITGPNGGGKTSLLRVILGLLKPISGKVRFFDGEVETDSLNLGYLPQKNMIDSRFPITVEEVVESGLISGRSLLNKRLSPKEKERVNEILELVGMESYRRAAIGSLSGGQLQRVLIGRSIISNPSVLVFDEPLSYVDKTFESKFYEIVEALAKDTTIILVSHEVTRIMQMANRHIIVDHGIEDCHAHRHYVRTDCL